jgi:cysteinyl-tRNA synthetase
MLKLYDSLSQTIKPFKPLNEPKVTLYVCGPTVYGDIHLGNARPVIFFDVLKRYLTWYGYEVIYASNITDVDDKIIEKAIELKKTELEITDEYTKNFIEMTLALGSHLPDEMPKATEYISQMIEYIKVLIELGHAYVKPSGVYFRVRGIKDYGILSNQNLDELNTGVRIVLEDEKEDPKDFTIWKTTQEGLSFSSPWGSGRPGWHTECAVMNHELFKQEIDIHGGGSDLKFPHHENEIAQSMAINHHHLARFWMHVGRLDLNDEKMSKSIGNITLVKDLMEAYDLQAFRLLMISHHYRQKINYSDELMMQYQKEYDKIKRTLKKVYLTLRLNKIIPTHSEPESLEQFQAYMDNDMNTPNVLTLILNLSKRMNKETNLDILEKLYQTVIIILEILGISLGISLEEQTLNDYRAWEVAREQKNYDKADQLRQKLIQQGWI